MRPGAFQFSNEWAETVRALGETGMGYTVVSIVLKDGRKYAQAVIDSGVLTRVRGFSEVPFSEEDIAEIVQTNEKWDWHEHP